MCTPCVCRWRWWVLRPDAIPDPNPNPNPKPNPKPKPNPNPNPNSNPKPSLVDELHDRVQVEQQGDGEARPPWDVKERHLIGLAWLGLG